MVFSSLFFLCIFLPVNIVLYFISTNKTYRNVLLLVTSLFFYAWGEPVWVTILIFTATFDYFNGLLVEKYHGLKTAKLALVASIAVNLFVLGFFKYSAFLTININNLLGIHLPYSTFRLPVGISFYTFQSMSYVIDVYRGEVAAQRSWYKFLLFVSLFHQLVAGPIVRYVDIAAEIDERHIDKETFSYGINRFVIGLGKKVIFANTAGDIANTFINSDISKLPVLSAWLGMAMYAIQIYFDFSGYSDMAIGLGKMFGFTYKENFNYPFIAKSSAEFWRRWHMSLSSFFKDYLYIPLGGSRKHQIRNIIIVWSLTGLWHGASWNLMAWGMYYGLFIILEKFLFDSLLQKLPAFISHVYALTIILVGFPIFYFTDLTKAFGYIEVMLGASGNRIFDSVFEITLYNNAIFILAAIVACTPVLKLTYQRLKRLMENSGLTAFMFDEIAVPILNFNMLAISIIFLVGKTYNPFLYFRF